MSDDQCESTSFSPPLWRQRRSFILETLRKHRVSSVLDFGCGEASVLAFLIPSPPSSDDTPFTKLAGIDIDQECVEEAVRRCQPWSSDHTELRENPLTIDIFHGSIAKVDSRLSGYEAIVCSEVIEHVYPDVLATFFNTTLGNYMPKIMIVTTPNAEYNIHFPSLHYGQPNAEFRHDDHKFEWTRQEFEDWCKAGAATYGYTYSFEGIGLLESKRDDMRVGHCTQACIFTRISQTPPTELPAQLQHRLATHIEFPFYNKPALSKESQKETIDYYIGKMCLSEEEYMKRQEEYARQEEVIADEALEWCVDWSEQIIAVPEIYKPPVIRQWTRIPLNISLSRLWDILEIRQAFKKYEVMVKLLQDNPIEYGINGDILSIKKAFEIIRDDSEEEQEEEEIWT
ncbi:hypothetical protein F4703DRAFT_1820172 [Phycomyces blakesleeanus]